MDWSSDPKYFIRILVLIWVGLFFWRLFGTAAAYSSTPDVENFRLFAEHHASRTEGKFSYLFTPFLLLCGALGIGLYRFWPTIRDGQAASDLDKQLLRMSVFTLFLTIIALLSLTQCWRATDAAAQMSAAVLERNLMSPLQGKGER